MALLLERLLAAANSGLFEYERERFLYPLKRRLLAAHAKFEGYNIQTIRHLCNRCDGTGYWHYWSYDADRCWKCGGTGTHHRSFNLLESWRLGASLFHTPVSRAVRLGKVGKPIKGLVKHVAVKPHAAHRALYLLLLFFDAQRIPQLLRYRLRFGKINQFLQSIRRLFYNASNAVEDWRIRIGLENDMIEHTDAAIMYDQTHPWVL
jgi:hypothetical protein